MRILHSTIHLFPLVKPMVLNICIDKPFRPRMALHLDNNQAEGKKKNKLLGSMYYFQWGYFLVLCIDKNKTPSPKFHIEINMMQVKSMSC